MSEEFDLSKCAAEPIHIPGAIQPHGVLLGVGEGNLEILVASENAGEMLGADGDLLGQKLDRFLRAEHLEKALDRDAQESDPLAIRFADGRAAHCVAHRSEGLVLLEMEASGEDGSLFRSGYRRLIGSLDRLRHASSIDEISAAAAREVSALTGFDRVMVYQFQADASGKVIAEARAEDFDESYLGLHFPASDIPVQARRLYVENPIRLIVDAAYEPVPLLPDRNPLTGGPLDLSHASLRSVSPIHCRYLLNMGVQGSMSISLVNGDELWGLIACHHRRRYHVPYGKRLVAELFAHAVSARIVELEQLETQTRKTEAYSVQSRLIDQMVAASRFQDGLVGEKRTLTHLLDCGSAAVLYQGEVTRIGDSPEEEAIRHLGTVVHDRAPGQVIATDRIGEWIGDREWPVESAAGCVAVPISADGLDFLFWFREEWIRSTTWAGDPEKAVGQCPDEGGLTPRSSFAAWVEKVRGRSASWAAWEVEIASDFRTALVASIIHQAAELERLNARLIRVGQQRDRFLATVSHELRNPLNAIMGWVAIARSGATGDMLARALEAIENNAVAQTELIDDLLDVARIESGQFRMEVKPLNFSQLVLGALDTVEPNARSRSITIETKLDDQQSDVIGDPQRLKQVIWNLLTNSIKFSEPESKIRVELGREDSQVVLTVRDEGIGIPADLLPNVFDPFKQGKTPARRAGLGLGLSIVKSIVELHNGKISAASKGKGRGASFRVTLPVAALRSTATVLTTTMGPAVTLDGVRILVVEDREDAARMVAILLESRGAVADTAHHGLAALEVLRQSPPFDLVISDLDMPEMDGFALIAAIRADPEFEAIPAIALTAFTRGGDRAKAITSGFQHHVAKPVDPAELVAVVASVLDRIGT